MRVFTLSTARRAIYPVVAEVNQEAAGRAGNAPEDGAYGYHGDHAQGSSSNFGDNGEDDDRDVVGVQMLEGVGAHQGGGHHRAFGAGDAVQRAGCGELPAAAWAMAPAPAGDGRAGGGEHYTRATAWGNGAALSRMIPNITHRHKPEKRKQRASKFSPPQSGQMPRLLAFANNAQIKEPEDLRTITRKSATDPGFYPLLCK